MTTTINASTSAGVVTTADTSGILQLQTASTAALTIDGSQQVGVGTASPASLLHVAGNIRTSSGANYAQFANNFLRSNASGSFFYDNATVGQSNEFRTSVSSSLDTTALTLTASGILALRNAGTSATGIGITFPATQSASSDANTLDDYEEGTWTPSVGGTATYSGQVGQYLKIGKFVFASFDLTINLIGTGSKSSITGLPFTAGSSSNTQAGTVAYWSDFAISTTSFYIRVDSGGTTITTASTTTTQITVTNTPNVLGNGTRLIATAIYTSNA